MTNELFLAAEQANDLSSMNWPTALVITVGIIAFAVVIIALVWSQR